VHQTGAGLGGGDHDWSGAGAEIQEPAAGDTVEQEKGERLIAQAKAQNGGGNPAHASVSSVARQIGGEFASEMGTDLGNEQRCRDCGIASDKARWNPTASDETAADDPG
jgi:hypothetical protein